MTLGKYANNGYRKGCALSKKYSEICLLRVGVKKKNKKTVPEVEFIFS